MFTARYGLIPYIKQITFRLLKVNLSYLLNSDQHYVIFMLLKVEKFLFTTNYNYFVLNCGDKA